ncbi:hypothetical protein [Chryseobacterium wangxinyae]|uniref:hypothetical protein n=1 Tax=Chryseobacterium sp. CY353 TaxID=2997334 RepID=UPI002270B4BA|nr:hypothetical protein [Chryseobacterium sp. CY353]MCY0970397.1 hypothetical protein [Chryseobacterium sp. CY353]
MKKGLIIISSLFTFLVSCQKESKENIQIEKNISMNKDIDILKEQLGKGLEATIGDAIDYQIEYKPEDVNLEGYILSDILKQHGFKTLTSGEFSAKIKLIFQRELDYSSNKNYIYINTIDKCNREIIYFQNNVLDYDGVFVHKKNNFIAPLKTIPELIDYQKKYPEIIEFEKKTPSKYLNYNGDDILIHRWMDESDLSQKRYETIQSIVAQNKYLFNDSKADLAWLKFNNKLFLESLVKIFGYTKDKDLLQFVLDNNYKNTVEFEKIIYNKKCNGEYIFNKDLIDLVSISVPEKKSEYLNAISDYLVREIKNKNSLFDHFSTKAEILGKLVYYSEKIVENTKIQNQFFNILISVEGGSEYEEEFKKANYYNIADFKNVWEKTKTAYPGME